MKRPLVEWIDLLGWGIFYGVVLACTVALLVTA